MLRMLCCTTMLIVGLSVAGQAQTQDCEEMAVCSLSAESTAAADVVRAYYQALESRDYSAAYQLWGQEGAASGKSYTDFAAGFAQTRSTAVRIQQVSPPDGAAGSMSVTVNVQVDATQANGLPQYYTGNYTLRRVNDVPGASPDQLRWHIDSADLKKVRP